MIRQGFVSNSSSSSFVIKYMDDMKFEDIPNRYSFNEKVPAEVRNWLQAIIWELYKSKAQIDKKGSIKGYDKESFDKESYLYPRVRELGMEFLSSDFLKNLLSEETEAYYRELLYDIRSEEWYKKAREVMRTSKDAWWIIEIGNYGSDVVGSIIIPDDISNSLEHYCEDIFNDPSTGIAEYGH